MLFRGLSAILILASLPMLTGCQDDDFGHKYAHGEKMGIIINVPSTWQGGSDEASKEAKRVCASVSMFDDNEEQPLYLHTTTEADTCLMQVVGAESRGIMRNNLNFHDFFSLSAICYVGTYPDESTNDLIPNFAYHQKYKNEGKPAEGDDLDWPGAGSKIRFFAFAPYDHANITLSKSTDKGNPRISYNVPENAKDHTDLMVAVEDGFAENVTLNFNHVLAAVKIKAAPTLVPCRVTKVIIDGIYTSGTYHMHKLDENSTHDENWDFDGVPQSGSCYAELNPNNGGTEGAAAGGSENSVSLVDGEYTFLMLPQTLKQGAKLTIELTDELTGTDRTISGSIGADDNSRAWEAGKLYSYEVSSESISVVADIKLNGDAFDKSVGRLLNGKELFVSPSDYELPYTGVMYDVGLEAKVSLSQINVDGPIDVPVKNIGGLTVEVSTDNGETWKEIQNPANAFALKNEDVAGVYDGAFDMRVADNNPYTLAKLNNDISTGVLGSESSPTPMETMHDKNETANCYMTDAPGYYSFPLVYGNAKKNGIVNSDAFTVKYPGNAATGSIRGMNYFVDYNNEEITAAKVEITGAEEAILVWQDSPDLVRDVHLNDTKDRVVFHIDERSIAQGNALIAVRKKIGGKWTILWSWHIWVTTTTNLNGWNSEHKHKIVATDSEDKAHTYYLTPSNLGYCEPREYKKSQSFQLKVGGTIYAKIDGREEGLPVKCPVKIYSFEQSDLEASYAGDNPYYQWGRKDPIPPGVYSLEQKNGTYTDKGWTQYGWGNKSNSNDIDRKKLFNVHEDYKRTRTHPTETTQGVSIGYTIQHPNEHIMGNDATIGTLNGDLNFRNHWHNNPGSGYLNSNPSSNEGAAEEDKIYYLMYNLWNAGATALGKEKSKDPSNFQEVTKTIYDPCPAGFHVPPGGAFLALSNAAGDKLASCYCGKKNNHPKVYDNYRYLTVEDEDKQPIKFYFVGMRDMNHKDPSLSKNNVILAEDDDKEGMFPGWKTDSWCSFNKVTFITTSTLVKSTSGYQGMIFVADHREPPSQLVLDDGDNDLTDTPQFKYAASVGSNDTYGMPVRPVQDKPSQNNE